jgi:hypothetical protein
MRITEWLREDAMSWRNDDFQRAADEARAEAGNNWYEMPTREQAQAIYARLRRIDTLRASAAMNASENPTAPSEAGSLVGVQD